ncbi:MAG: toast rack family protein [Anaerolineales bacterium]|nr:toast rack family protein [Anaerolineales bacterium]MCX7755286.1 toast rack family protein [Anaerolineales bacterium]MDW8278467.1 toast rack family protein [Anaerolineales bacterium]
MPKPILLALLVFVLAASACRIDFAQSNTPAPEVTEEINIPIPDSESIHLTLEFGAGDLSLSPGAEGYLVRGTATYNLPAFKLEIETNAGDIVLRQGESRVSGLPNFENLKNEWALQLGNRSMALEIRAGAYQGRFDLGGVPLTSLDVSDGASDVTLDFSALNPEKMSLFTYKTGASNISLKNLANANFVSMVFESGAGNYKLDFNGELQRDASVVIRSGMSNLTLVIPAGCPATVRVNEGISNVQFPETWSKNGTLYTQTGEGPALMVVIEMGAGNVQILP